MWREDVTVPACNDLRPCEGKMLQCQLVVIWGHVKGRCYSASLYRHQAMSREDDIVPVSSFDSESLWTQTGVITGFEVKSWNQFIVLLLYYSLNFSLVPVLHDPLRGKNGTHFDKWHRNCDFQPKQTLYYEVAGYIFFSFPESIKWMLDGKCLVTHFCCSVTTFGTLMFEVFIK